MEMFNSLQFLFFKESDERLTRKQKLQFHFLENVQYTDLFQITLIFNWCAVMATD